jgi:hypothetical protein
LDYRLSHCTSPYFVQNVVKAHAARGALAMTTTRNTSTARKADR